MPNADRHYLDYLGRFGIENAAPRVVEHESLRVGHFRAFSLDSTTSGPYRAMAADDGLIAPGKRPDDAWHSFLGTGPAVAVAGRIAWLESADRGDLHEPAGGLCLAVTGADLTFPVDPVLRAGVTHPVMDESADGARTLIAWYARDGGEVVERWRVTAPSHGPSHFEVKVYPAVQPAADAEARVRPLLVSPRANDRLWAVNVFATQPQSAAAAAAVPALLEMLGDTDADVREAVAVTLGRIGDVRAIGPLARACERSQDAAERRQLVQVLSAFGEPAVEVLTRLSGVESGTELRLEVVHALAHLDSAGAGRRLAELARDPDEAVRELVGSYLALTR